MFYFWQTAMSRTEAHVNPLTLSERRVAVEEIEEVRV